MESVLWALNLVAVCVLCAWALKEDSRPSASDQRAEATRLDRIKAKSGMSARRQLPRK